MRSSDIVALLSVVVAGVVSPLLALLTVRWQLLRTATEGRSTDRRSVLDQASVELAQYLRAVGHTQALWRHGRFDDDEEAQEQRRTRIAAQEGIVAAHGRICLRFGPESEVARRYGDTQPAIASIDTALRAYRKREPFGMEDEQKMTAGYQALADARLNFLDAAHRAEFGGQRSIS